jgi:chromosome segregation ATPase
MIDRVFTVNQVGDGDLTLKVLGMKGNFCFNSTNIANAQSFFSKVAHLYCKDFAHDNLLKEAEVFCTYLEKENLRLAQKIEEQKSDDQIRRQSDLRILLEGKLSESKKEIKEKNIELASLSKALKEKNIEIMTLLKEIKELKATNKTPKDNQLEKLEAEIEKLKASNMKKEETLNNEIEKLKASKANCLEMNKNHIEKNAKLKQENHILRQDIEKSRGVPDQMSQEFVRSVIGRALKNGII